MKNITEPARTIPVREEVDVLVVGGGPAGISAAVSAGRLGAKTMLVEQFGDVGGVSTVGLMSHWTGKTRGGFYEEILDASQNADSQAIRETPFLRQAINPEKLKTAYLDLLDGAGVKLRLYTMAERALRRETTSARSGDDSPGSPGAHGDANNAETVTGIVTESKSGREAILASRVIDASGDGDIAADAGVPFHKGRESDGLMQPMTLMFKVAGVETDRAVFPGGFEDNVSIPAGKIQELGKEHLPAPAGHVLLYRSSLPGVVTCNMTNVIGVDGTDAADLTKAHVTTRRQLDAIVAFLRRFVPGFENCYVIDSASAIGVRETRHFQGEYVLTREDILAARVFDDWVVTKAHFNFDVHNLTGSGLDETGAQKKFPQKRGYTIPYRCLLPLGVENLLLAGRNISGSHMAHSNFRVMPIVANVGQAAGIAAALSVSRGVSPRELPARAIQEVLIQTGVEAPEAVHG